MTKFPRKSLFCDEHELLRRTLREARRRRGLTQAVVAAECGWPQSVIAKIEQGERRIDVVEFVWIAAAMGAHPVRLFGKFAAKLSPPEPVDADGAGKKKAEKPRDAANPRAVKATKRRPRQRISNKTVAAGSVTQ